MMNREARQYWAERRRANMRDRGNWSHESHVTIALIVLMVLVTFFQGPVATLAVAIDRIPGGFIVDLLMAALFTGGLLGLIFQGVFLWMIGGSIEGVVTVWQYLAVFFVGSAVGAFFAGAVAGQLPLPFLASFGVFGVAGAYALLMSRWAGRGPSLQWLLVLLAINVVLSFSVPGLVGMVTAFGAGAGILYVMERQPGIPRRRRWPR